MLRCVESVQASNMTRSMAVVVLLPASLLALLAAPSLAEFSTPPLAESEQTDVIRKNNSSEISHLVIGGRDAALNQFPSIVLLSNGCGGNIIDRNWILTAAHCVRNSRVDQTWIMAGSNGRWDSNAQYIWASEIRIHSGYRWTGFDSNGEPHHPHDVALIRLRQPLTLNNSVRVAALLRNPLQGGERAVIAGWGQTVSSDSNSGSATLKFADVTVVSRAQCQRVYGSPTVGADQVCAGGDGRGICMGDSGGPLYANGWLVGVSSWTGSPCGHAGRPGVFASIAAHLPWIRQQTGLNL